MKSETVISLAVTVAGAAVLAYLIKGRQGLVDSVSGTSQALTNVSGAVSNVGGLVSNVADKANDGVNALWTVSEAAGRGLAKSASAVAGAVSSVAARASGSSGAGKAKIIDVKTAEPLKTASASVNTLITTAHDRIVKNLPK